MSVNSVVLVGRLTRDPELRETTTGKKVANFGIAVNKRFKPKDGSSDADFFNVTCWGASAEFASTYLGKGRLVAIEGRLSQRKYTTQDGTEREVVEVVADNVQGLDKRDAPAQGKNDEDNDGYDPFADE